METKTDDPVVLLASPPHPGAHGRADEAFVLCLAFSAVQPGFVQPLRKQTTGRLPYSAVDGAAGCLFDRIGFCSIHTAVFIGTAV